MNECVREMTLQEKAESIINLINHKDINAEYLYNWQIDFIKELCKKQLTDGWIPVSESVPTKEEYLKDDGRFVVTDEREKVLNEVEDAMYHRCFECDNDEDMQKWDSGNWIRYKLFENVMEQLRMNEIEKAQSIIKLINDYDRRCTDE